MYCSRWLTSRVDRVTVERLDGWGRQLARDSLPDTVDDKVLMYMQQMAGVDSLPGIACLTRVMKFTQSLSFVTTQSL